MSGQLREPRRASAPDPLTPEQRRLNMSRIRARDTKPEMLLRRALHRAGLRYRLHDRALPGTPDLVLRSRRAVIFVHGCFWHGHECPKGVLPATRAEFWAAKLAANCERDEDRERQLLALGWRVVVVWECALVGRARRELEEVVSIIRGWLAGHEQSRQVSGRWGAERIGGDDLR